MENTENTNLYIPKIQKIQICINRKYSSVHTENMENTGLYTHNIQTIQIYRPAHMVNTENTDLYILFTQHKDHTLPKIQKLQICIHAIYRKET